MREIKFRVWTGSKMEYDIMTGKFGTFYVNPTNNGLNPHDSASITSFTTKYQEPVELMQFTGLKDKNNLDIYEGDIIDTVHTDGKGQVVLWVCEWFEEEASFYFSPFPMGKGYGGALYGFEEFAKAWEEIKENGVLIIIGNIYENSELLNEK